MITPKRLARESGRKSLRRCAAQNFFATLTPRLSDRIEAVDFARRFVAAAICDQIEGAVLVHRKGADAADVADEEFLFGDLSAFEFQTAEVFAAQGRYE